MTDELAALVLARQNDPEAPVPPNVFVNNSGTVCRVTNVNSSYARLEMMGGGHYSMPIAEYDTLFVERWRPARPEDFRAATFDDFRPPANATPEWLEGRG